jgi:hypothetical protein
MTNNRKRTWSAFLTGNYWKYSCTFEVFENQMDEKLHLLLVLWLTSEQKHLRAGPFPLVISIHFASRIFSSSNEEIGDTPQ